MTKTATFVPDNCVLGDTRGPLQITSADDNRGIALSMARQARRTLCITSRHLDPIVYNTHDFCDAVAGLATRSRFSRIRMLIRSSEVIVKEGHCLVDLARKLSSFIQIRRYGKNHMNFNGAFLVADDVGYLDCQLSDRYEATADFCDPYKTKELFKQFQAMWDASEADPDLRRLHL